MCELSELEPLIVTSHEKGPNRGISIYFGINEIRQLEENGISFKDNRRFLVRTTTNNRIVLIPFSEVNFALNIEDKLDKILELEKDDLESFGEDLLNIISENKIEISEKERYSVYQFTKNHYTRYNIRNTVQIGMRANKEATENLIKQYIEKKED